MQSVHLIGVEAVQNAGLAMQRAAEEMSRAAASYEDTARREQLARENYLFELDALAKRIENAAKVAG